MRTRLSALLFALCCCAAVAAQPLLTVSFARDAWTPADWVLAKNPTVNHYGQWVQRDKCLENATSDDPAKKSALDQSLTTMVYKDKFAGNYTVSATLEIGAGSAPGIILAQDWAPDEQGRPQYGEFYEAIIYEKGINLWHHFARDGKRTWEKTAYATFALEADTPYKFEVRRQGKSVQMTVDGHQIGVLVPPLADELYLGVEGCEGVSHVYDFSVVR